MFHKINLKKTILTQKYFSSFIKTELISSSSLSSSLSSSSSFKIAIITLSDPLKLNSLSEEMGEEFTKTIFKINNEIKDKNIRACIITGDGDAFSAGGNLNWLEERHNHSPVSNCQTMIKFYNLYLSVRHLQVPTIAAINGHAIGAGMCMTLACDFRIAAENAKIGFTFTKLGIHPGMGASVLLPRLISPQRAFEYLLTGATVSGTTAQQHGLVLEAVPKNEVLPKAIQLAESLGVNAPIAVQTCIQSLRADKFTGLDDGLLREANAQAAAYASKDLLVGIHAIRNKIHPQFNGW